MGSAQASVKLHASADEVWKDITNFDDYSSWSKQVSKVDYEDKILKAGSRGEITVSIKC